MKENICGSLDYVSEPATPKARFALKILLPADLGATLEG